MQLYVEGPFDKWFTFLSVDEPDHAVTIPTAFEDREGVAYLGGRDLKQLFQAERDGTRIALDVHLPAGAPADAAFPTIVLFTPYYRRFALRPGHRADLEASPNTAQFRDAYVPHGSPPNTGARGRRNIFLTFNKASDGDMRATYYRDKWANYAPNRADEARGDDTFRV